VAIARRLVLLVGTLVGCGPGPALSDAAPAVDAVLDAGLDGGVDAASGDAGFDASAPRCDELALDGWDLGAGTWSRDLGPRGLSFDGPGPAAAMDLAVYDHALFVAGHFSHAGPIAASNVAVWTPASGWSAVGEGLAVAVRKIVVAPGGTVYAAERSAREGDPTPIHRYASGAWAPIGTADSDIEDLAIDADGSLLAGGFFRSIDGVSTPYSFARWDGSWTSLDQFAGSDVGAILVDAGGLCIGGRAGGSGGYVACRALGGSAWDVMPTPRRPAPPYPNPVNAIVRDPSDRVVIGGGVYLGADEQLGGALRWGGGGWEMLGEGLSDSNSPMEVYSLARADDGGIYAVGTFTTIGWYSTPTSYALHVARWSGDAWWNIGGLQNGYPEARAVATDGLNTYFGGGMTEAFSPGVRGGWHAVAGVVRYDGTGWSALEHPGSIAHGPGRVQAIAVRGVCRPYVAGDFQVVEDRLVSHVGAMAPDGAIADVASRSGFLSSVLRALVVGADGTLYAGGSLYVLDSTGRETRTTLARRVRGEWETFGALDATAAVRVLAVAADGSLYVGGDFSDDASPERSHLLRWDGAAWSAVGARMDPLPVSALTIDGAPLYIAERLPTGGSRVSRFESGTWTMMGDFLAGYVGALAIHRGVLVAGGTGLVDDSPIAILEGGTWVAMGPPGSSASSDIRAFAVLGDELVAGGAEGYGPSASGILVRRTASGWESVGDGIDGAVEALAFTADGLLVGGRFEIAGGVPSWGLALLRRP